MLGFQIVRRLLGKNPLGKMSLLFRNARRTLERVPPTTTRRAILRAMSGEEAPRDLIMEKIPAMQLGVDGAESAPREGATIAIMRMARPAARNALGKNMLQQMRDAIEEVPMDPEIRAVILTSDVERVFCAGADLKERREMTQLEAGMFVSKLRNTFTALGALGTPVIAAVEGAALGGGLEIALACDIRVAGEKVRDIGMG